jgi:hypothetical protein
VLPPTLFPTAAPAAPPTALPIADLTLLSPASGLDSSSPLLKQTTTRMQFFTSETPDKSHVVTRIS